MVKKGRKSLKAGKHLQEKPQARKGLPPHLQRLIAQAAASHQTELLLSYNGLTDVPEEIRELESLEILSLSNNGISEIPEWLGKLPRIRSLRIFNNPIEKLPDIHGLHIDWHTYLRFREALSPSNIQGISISTGETSDSPKEVSEPLRLLSLAKYCPLLESLDIGSGGIPIARKIVLPPPDKYISELLQMLAEFRNLTELTLFGISLNKIPEAIGQLKKLKKLMLRAVDIHYLPKWITDLTKLRNFDIGVNEIQKLPDWFSTMGALEELRIDNNPLTAFPEVLFELPQLRAIYMDAWSERGTLKEIPARITDLTNLVELTVDGHPIETPPPEVVGQGIDAIKSYWRQRQEAGVDFLCEAKLLLVGEPGAGKTSLANKIVDPNYELKPSEPSTEGIDVSRWRFPAALRVGAKGKEKITNQEFRVNIWDFGGQEIYHATHSSFSPAVLSMRS